MCKKGSYNTQKMWTIHFCWFNKWSDICIFEFLFLLVYKKLICIYFTSECREGCGPNNLESTGQVQRIRLSTHHWWQVRQIRAPAGNQPWGSHKQQDGEKTYGDRGLRKMYCMELDKVQVETDMFTPMFQEISRGTGPWWAHFENHFPSCTQWPSLQVPGC